MITSINLAIGHSLLMLFMAIIHMPNFTFYQRLLVFLKVKCDNLNTSFHLKQVAVNAIAP